MAVRHSLYFGFLLLGIILLTLPLAVFLSQQQQKTQQQAAGNACRGMSIIAYWSPSGTDWNTAIAAAPATKLIVANVNSGPGSGTDPAFASAINKAKAAGIIVTGYVDSLFGKRPIANVEAEIDAWKQLYGVTSTMLDDGYAPDSFLAYYQSITNYVHKNGGVTVLNSGDVTTEGYMQVVDYFGDFEHAYSQYQNWSVPSWVYKYPSTKFIHMVYGVPNTSASLHNAMNIANNNNGGYMMFTDSNNPWTGTPSPSFWTAWINEVRTMCNIAGGTPVPTPQLTTTPSTRPTSPQGGITLSLTVCPHGLGTCGDNANPTSTGNTTPIHLQRTVTITFLNAQNQQVGSAQGAVLYTSSAGNFQGTINATISSGQYLVRAQTDGFLPKQAPGIITVTSGQQTAIPSIALATGDINNDGQVDILDYNILVSCFGSKMTTASCTNPPNAQSPGADIDDDGKVDGADYNLFLRELSVQHSG